MAKSGVKEKVEDILKDFFADEGYELYNCEFVKEGAHRVLRVYADRTDGQYVGTDDCERISRFLSEKLDEEDPIPQNYYLEVSSPGMDRELFTEEHMKRFSGSQVDVKLYRSIGGRKEFTCLLKGADDGRVILEDEDGEMVLERKEIAKIKLAVVF